MRLAGHLDHAQARPRGRRRRDPVGQAPRVPLQEIHRETNTIASKSAELGDQPARAHARRRSPRRSAKQIQNLSNRWTGDDRGRSSSSRPRRGRERARSRDRLTRDRSRASCFSVSFTTQAAPGRRGERPRVRVRRRRPLRRHGRRRAASSNGRGCSTTSTGPGAQATGGGVLASGTSLLLGHRRPGGAPGQGLGARRRLGVHPAAGLRRARRAPEAARQRGCRARPSPP